MARLKLYLLLLGLAVLFAFGAAAAQAPVPAQAPAQALAQAQPERPDPTLLLKIGDPRLKDKTMEVGLGAILSGETGRAVAFDRMIQEMRPCRLVYIGETHNSLPMHEVQYQVIRALYGQDRHLAVGLEMLPVTVQEALNRWSAGELTKDEFLRAVRWYVNWNFNFGFYEKILDFAKEHRLPVYALNVPREVITKVRMRGWEALTDEEKAFVPTAPDLANKDHRTLIRTIFESSDIPPQMRGAGLDMMFEGLYRGQSAWDEVMSDNSVRGAESEGRRVVVCAGSGHLLYNLGLNRRAFEKSGLAGRTVVAVTIPAGAKSVRVSRTYADYVFAIAEEAKPAFPTIGLALKKVENLTNLVVESKPTEGAASRADFEKGDVVLAVDGRTYDDINELRMELAKLRCGGEVKFKVLRSGQVRDVSLKCEKAAPAGPDAKK
ncbi:MAG TPA: ChaN family lipoprotein [Terriglobales bacterium]|nr:ChaN family lipoprotein [Terriglobales bacterium]